MWYDREDFSSLIWMQSAETGSPYILEGLAGDLAKDINEKRFTNEIFERPNSGDIRKLLGYIETNFFNLTDDNKKELGELKSLIYSLSSAVMESETYSKALIANESSVASLVSLVFELYPIKEAIQLSDFIGDKLGRPVPASSIFKWKLQMLEHKDRAITQRMMYSATRFSNKRG